MISRQRRNTCGTPQTKLERNKDLRGTESGDCQTRCAIGEDQGGQCSKTGRISRPQKVPAKPPRKPARPGHPSEKSRCTGCPLCIRWARGIGQKGLTLGYPPTRLFTGHHRSSSSQNISQPRLLHLRSDVFQLWQTRFQMEDRFQRHEVFG